MKIPYVALIKPIRDRRMRAAWHLANFIGAAPEIIETLRIAADSFENCGPQRGAVFAMLDEFCNRAASQIQAAHEAQSSATAPQVG